MAINRRGRLENLFLIDARKRLINNTPYDVLRLASGFPRDRVEVIDLRFHPPELPLPPSDRVSLFLETAGTWMCFDWDPQRFQQRLDSLRDRSAELTVVGPQARAVSTLTGLPFRVIERLDFQKEFLGNQLSHQSGLSNEWLEPHFHGNYNGEFFDGIRMQLARTFSIGCSMNCPMQCSFCYYADKERTAKPAFSAFVSELERIWEHGFTHFYFTDPNFLLTAAEFTELRDLYERTRYTFSYYCQVSPNFLTTSRIQQLAGSGCHGMVIGIENRVRIADKGSIEEARERITAVRAAGMMPMLFFMIDGENEIEDLVGEFTGIPFRYTVINHAFASDRSLSSISAAFEAKRQLAARYRGVIERLQRRPDYLGFAQDSTQFHVVSVP
jgi:hypothetical protein